MYRRIQTEADQTHTLYTCLNMYLVRNDTNSASLASWIYSILSFTTTGLTVTLRIDSLWALQNKPKMNLDCQLEANMVYFCIYSQVSTYC